jgi:glycosyltransferase involved in cell wall biosynthesis
VTLERLTSRITRHFIAVSSANIETGIRLKLFAPSRVSLIRSGIETVRFQEYADDSRPDFEQWRKAKCHDLALPPDQPLVGIVACFKSQKAPLDFVRVIKRIVESMPGVHAVMVGDGVLRPEIEALIAHYDLKKTISLLGWRTDVPELLPLFDVFVLTSLWEGLPRVCPQAMAAALPIVATHVDGIPEAVHDGINGFLRPPGDIEGIADKVMYLLQHPDIAKQMGLEGRQRVREFDIQRMMQQQEELYRSLVSELK